MSGSQLADQLEGMVATAGLADDLVALLLQGLAQVEPDDGFVFGNHDSDRHAPEALAEGSCDGYVAAVRASRSWSWVRSSSAIEVDEVGAVLGHRVGVPLGVTGLDAGVRRLGHQRPDAHVVGLVAQVGELLVGDAQLLAQRLQPAAHLTQLALDRPTPHMPAECSAETGATRSAAA